MAAGNYDILIEQGATFEITLTLKDTNATPIDLTDLDFRGKIKKAFTDVAAVAEFDFEKLDQTDPDTVGKIKVSLPALITQGLDTSAKGTVRTLTTMVYDIESQHTVTQFVTRWLQGQAMISPEVTTP